LALADVIVAGDVITMDSARPRAEAFALRGNTILAIGSLDEVVAACPPGTPVDRPAGAVILPGLIDAHCHLQVAGLKLLRRERELSRVLEVDEALAVLDEDPFGEAWPDGELTMDDRVDAIAAAQRLVHALGITGVIDPAASSAEVSAYQEARFRGVLTVRVVAMPYPDLDGGVDGAIATLRAPGIRTGFGDEVLRIGGVKVYFDGLGMAGTALRREPWPETGEYGTQRVSIEAFERLARACAEAGWSLGVHVVGGGGIDAVLEAFEAIAADVSLKELRFTLIHAYLEPSAENMALAAKLGVVLATQPSIQWVNGPGLVQRLGSDAAASNPLRDWLDAGVTVAAGSDAPAFPIDPRLGFVQATTRAVRDGDAPLGPEQAVTPQEALAMYTTGASWASGAMAYANRGALAVGMGADWTACSVDPLTATPEALRAATFSRTVVGGGTVHASDGGPPPYGAFAARAAAGLDPAEQAVAELATDVTTTVTDQTDSTEVIA
jgi:predicted amidohydrolase YtcJ